jgi:Na+-transporting methylmalonyl-CoA/oxaloacetate decarboxylase gamma subunit
MVEKAKKFAAVVLVLGLFILVIWGIQRGVTDWNKKQAKNKKTDDANPPAAASTTGGGAASQNGAKGGAGGTIKPK